MMPEMVKIGPSYHFFGLFANFFPSAPAISSTTSPATRLWRFPVPTPEDYVIRVHKLCQTTLHYDSLNPDTFNSATPGALINATGISGLFRATVGFICEGVSMPIPISEGGVFPVGKIPQLYFLSQDNLYANGAAKSVYEGFLHVELCPKNWYAPNPFALSKNLVQSWNYAGAMPAGTYQITISPRGGTVVNTQIASLVNQISTGICSFGVIEYDTIRFNAWWKVVQESTKSTPSQLLVVSGFDSVGTGAFVVLDSLMFPENLDNSAIKGIYTGYSGELNYINSPLQAHFSARNAINEVGRLQLVLNSFMDLDVINVNISGRQFAYGRTPANLNP